MMMDNLIRAAQKKAFRPLEADRTAGTPRVQALALGIDPAWRRLPAERRRADVAAFGASLDQVLEVTTRCYSSFGGGRGSTYSSGDWVPPWTRWRTRRERLWRPASAAGAR